MASIDFYINETTSHAHIILPPTSSLERGHYDLAFHLLAVRNTAKFSPALFQPGEDTRHDWEILLELQTRMEQRRFTQSREGKVNESISSGLRECSISVCVLDHTAQVESFFERSDSATSLRRLFTESILVH